MPLSLDGGCCEKAASDQNIEYEAIENDGHSIGLGSFGGRFTCLSSNGSLLHIELSRPPYNSSISDIYTTNTNNIQ